MDDILLMQVIDSFQDLLENHHHFELVDFFLPFNPVEQLSSLQVLHYYVNESPVFEIFKYFDYVGVVQIDHNFNLLQ